MTTNNYTEQFFDLAYKMCKQDEGERQDLYDDKTGRKIILNSGGNITGGIGRNFSSRKLSPDEILYLFENDLHAHLGDCRDLFPDYDSYSINRQLGILNLIFNMGLTKFLGFKKTIAAIKDENWQYAAAELTASIWYRQVGDRAGRVISLIKDDLYEY